MSLSKLLTVAPPPFSPVANGTMSQWDDVERELGVNLPEGYKQYVNLYGAGSFADNISIVTPFSQENIFTVQNDFFKWVEAGRNNYEGMKKTFGKRMPEKFPFSSYPPVNGLMAVGGYESGGIIYWLTNEKPEDWTIVIYDEEFYEYEHHPVSLIEFMVGWLTGQISSFLIENLSEHSPKFQSLKSKS